jgi:hypothetical protein
MPLAKRHTYGLRCTRAGADLLDAALIAVAAVTAQPGIRVVHAMLCPELPLLLAAIVGSGQQ